MQRRSGKLLLELKRKRPQAQSLKLFGSTEAELLTAPYSTTYFSRTSRRARSALSISRSSGTVGMHAAKTL
jgi:hypothetical protein